MLTEITLENFKRFRDRTILPFGRLNLLTGINSQGKSTTLQPILLLHQSLDPALTGALALERIELNGRYVHLGNFREMQSRHRPPGDLVYIGFEFSDPVTTTRTGLWIDQPDGNERWGGLKRLEVESFKNGQLEPKLEFTAELGRWLTLDFHQQSSDALRCLDNVNGGLQFNPLIANKSYLQELGRVHYVSADRLGPQDFFPRVSNSGFSSVGVRGEQCAEVLYRAQQDQRVAEQALQREDAATQTVVDQASAWLSFIFDGGALRVTAPSPSVPILALEMNADGTAHYVRPVNLGFGYSYALPILVAGLIARPGDILIVENPEAHLHPLAQSRLGEFLSRVSTLGVQVFVESHSEHILNAFRLALREGHLASDDLVVLFFRRDVQDPVLRVSVGSNGHIVDWPSGFFDQRTQDFVRLFGQ